MSALGIAVAGAGLIGRDGLKTLVIVEAAAESARTGRPVHIG